MITFNPPQHLRVDADHEVYLYTASEQFAVRSSVRVAFTLATSKAAFGLSSVLKTEDVMSDEFVVHRVHAHATGTEARTAYALSVKWGNRLLPLIEHSILAPDELAQLAFRFLAPVGAVAKPKPVPAQARPPEPAPAAAAAKPKTPRTAKPPAEAKPAAQDAQEKPDDRPDLLDDPLAELEDGSGQSSRTLIPGIDL